ncbi:MAG: ABC transporter ATP-binding protein [Chloroflexi bacterium]|nr:ABC transporter ATP-binding protein [Chloroflexota bacterium]
MVQVNHLTKQFDGLTAVDDLSFTVNEGEIVALWGANGAGKTTVLRCILNLTPYDGEIIVAGMNAVAEGKAVRQRIGFVPQELTFHDDMTVQETMTFYALLKKLGYEYNFTPLLARLDLAAHAQKPVHDLSGGLKQRLALALALLSDPPILLLDEPTSSLDVAAREDFMGLLLELKAAGKTMIFSSHRLEEMLTLADRVLVMADGRLQVDCPPSQLTERLGRPMTLYLHMSGNGLVPAMQILSQHGLTVNQNGRGLWVQVEPDAKGEPLRLLYEAGIPVNNFELDQ